MGMESYAIRDDAISASSFKKGSEPYNARVTGRKSWSPLDSDTSPFLEVKFESVKLITSVLTQGGDNGEMVKTFTVQYLPEGLKDFVDVMTNLEIETSDGKTVIKEVAAQLPGNRDDHTIRENIFHTPIRTAVIRILPIRQTGNQPLSLRVELRGCDDVAMTTSTPFVVETTSETEVKTTQLPPEGTTSQSIIDTTTTEVSRSTPIQKSTTTTESIVVKTTTKATETITTTTSAEGLRGMINCYIF